MAAMSHAELDVWFKAAAAVQLDTFSETITISAYVYKNATGTSYTNSTYYATSTHSQTWSLGYDTAVFNNDLDAGIGTGLVAESQDVAASVSNAVRSAVDKIEATVGNVSISALVCHNSCHTSCHSSRGRR
jgi:signal transduction histidine kinase